MNPRTGAPQTPILASVLLTLFAWAGCCLAALVLLDLTWLAALRLAAVMAVVASAACLGGILVATRHFRRIREAMITEQDRRNRLIVDAAADAILTFNHQGRIESFNAAAVRLFGYTPEEVIGRDISLLIGGEDTGPFDSLLQKALQTGRSVVLTGSAQFEGRHKSGQAIPIELGVSKVLDVDRRVYVQIIRDLTERHQAEKQRQLQYEVARWLAGAGSVAEVGPHVLQTLGESLGWHVGLLWQVDSEAGLLRCAAGWGDERYAELIDHARLMLHPPGSGLCGRAWRRRELRWQADLAREPAIPLANVALRLALRGQLALPLELAGEFLGVLEFYAPSLEAPAEPLLRSIYPVATQLAQFLQRKRDEEALRTARDTAEAANRAKSEFLTNVSHEIRTPLNGIIGLTEVLLAGTVNEQQREHLALVQASGETLLALINDLLDFAKIEAARMTLEELPFEPRKGMEPTLKTLGIRARQKSLRLSWHIADEVPSVVIGDPLRLQQVLLNLVGNAIKFTPAGEVAVRLTVAARTPREVVLHGIVRDTGIGIPPDKQEVIFEAFRQADASRARKFGGTGLGLTITSRLVSLMGGKLWVESAAGQGSTFHFTACLRLAEAAAVSDSPGLPYQTAEARALLATADACEGCRILVAEDNPVNRELFDLILQKRRHEVTFVTTGREAVAACAGSSFDVVLMDLQLPEVDGLEAARQILGGAGEGVPIVGLSAYYTEDDRRRCLEAGMRAYVAKPVQPAELLRLIDEVVRRQ